MNQTLKRKITAIITSLVSLATIVVICVTSSILITRFYYDTIFVSGCSMNPTLYGGEGGLASPPYIDGSGIYHHGDYVNFGLVDKSLKAKQNIKRYDIVTTYYPADYNASGKVNKNATYKIKRVIALPGETFKIEQGVLSVKENGEYRVVERTHLIDDGGIVDVKDTAERTLGKDEFWLLGDHRNDSSDSGSMKRAITINMITGVLVTIQGLAEIYIPFTCEKCHYKINDIEQYLRSDGECPRCGGNVVSGKLDIRDRQYTYPKYI